MKSRPDESLPRSPTGRYKGLGPAAGLAFGAGFSLIGSALAGYLIGSYLDRNRSGALFAPVGLVLGLLSGLHRMYTLFRQIARSKEKPRR